MAEKQRIIRKESSISDLNENIVNTDLSDDDILTQSEIDMLFSNNDIDLESTFKLESKLKNSIMLQAEINKLKSSFAYQQIERYVIQEEDSIELEDSNLRLLNINNDYVATIVFYPVRYMNNIIAACSLESFKLILSYLGNSYASYITSTKQEYINFRLWLYDNNYTILPESDKLTTYIVSKDDEV